MQKSDHVAQTAPAAPRARGRPRAFDRKEALAKATRLFWTKGYEATSLADLTDAMGIGSPSLYAAFGSKDALYAEALRHYRDSNEAFVWAGFYAAETARQATMSLLMDSAAALTGCIADIPRGCMVALSSIGSEGHSDLGDLLRSARAATLDRLEARFSQAMDQGEIATSTDVHALARFIQTVQNGMSILARDGATREDLEAVAKLTLLAWDARIGLPPFAGPEQV